jgi:hypothetical protein
LFILYYYLLLFIIIVGGTYLLHKMTEKGPEICSFCRVSTEKRCFFMTFTAESVNI